MSHCSLVARVCAVTASQFFQASSTDGSSPDVTISSGTRLGFKVLMVGVDPGLAQITTLNRGSPRAKIPRGVLMRELAELNILD